MNLNLNLRHRIGLFLTVVVVGFALVLDASPGQAVGIGLLGLAATWLMGAIRVSASIQKLLATTLIAIFGIFMLGLQRVKYSEDTAEFSGQVFAAAFIVLAFITSIRWRIHLDGHANAWKQALAIFAVVFCGWGLLLVLSLFLAGISSSGHWLTYVTGATMAALYVLGLRASSRWLGRLRKQTAETPKDAAPAFPVPRAIPKVESSSTPPVEERSHQAPNGTRSRGVLGPYVWLSVELVLVAFFMALVLFDLTSQVISGVAADAAYQAGQSLGKVLIPTIVLLYAAKRSWKSLTEQEPENIPHFGRKHRRFKAIVGASILTILAVGIAVGTLAGKRLEKNKKIEALLTQIARQAPKNNDFRQRLGAIRSADTPTMQDYYMQCLDLENLLDEFEPLRQQTISLLGSLGTETESPSLFATIKIMQQINEKDAEVIAALRREISKAKELIALPEYLQERFYAQEILPIQAQIEKLADEEVALLREAQKKGLKLPSDVADWLKQE